MTKDTWQGPARYRIKMGGRLGPQWTNWFDGLRVACQGGMTVVSGRMADQAALHGVLAKIRDLGMPIISVRRMDDDDMNRPEEL